VCDRAFIKAYQLNRHKLVHTQPSDYVCDVCGKVFTRAGYLKQHRLRHDMDVEKDEEDKEPYRPENREKDNKDA
jgi:uncharacterized Zn-finger protein